MAVPLAAKAGIAVAKSKNGRRVIGGVAVLLLSLPVVVIGAPIGLILVTVSAISASAEAPAGEGPACASANGDEGQACEVSSDKRELAEQIVAATGAGKIAWLDSRHFNQVRTYATDSAVSKSCLLDVRVLQTIVIAQNMFGSVGVSSLNRQCTGEVPAGSSTTSPHWFGRAVDFYSFGGSIANGADSSSRSLIAMLDPLVTPGSRVGQVQCRGGNPVPTKNFSQFNDACHHLHVDFAAGEAPLPLEQKDSTHEDH